MKLIDKKKESVKWSQFIAPMLLLFAMSFAANLPVSAQGISGDTNLSTGGNTLNDQNPHQTQQTMVDYGNRWGYWADIHAADKTENYSGETSDSKAQTRTQKSQENFAPQIGDDPIATPITTGPNYVQPLIPNIQVPKQKRDTAIFKHLLKTFGYPCSDTQYQMICRANNQRALEMKFDPERTMWQSQAQSLAQSQAAAGTFANSAQSGTSTMMAGITGGPSVGGGAGGAGGGSGAMGALINIANENSGTPTTSDAAWKPISGAVWMVQQMYKFVFVPMAILFLLPGAVLTQVKGQVASGILGQQAPSPFEGILRAMIAVFLIPSTQLIMSYAIDVGNSLTYSVNDYVDTSVINSWTQQTIYLIPNGNALNGILGNGSSAGGAGGGGGAGSGSPGSLSSLTGSADSYIKSSLDSALGNSVGNAAASLVTPGLNSAISGLFGSLLNDVAGSGVFSGIGGDGLSVNTPDSQAVQEEQLATGSTLTLVLNAAIYFFTLAVLILGAYQLIFMCYLYLLGPLAAAFFAWPVIGGSNASAPNSNVFSGWVDAVIVVSLWRFYWMVILAIMTQRILWMMDTGQQLNLQWEVTVFICFLGLMMYVPFHPWDYDPGKAFTQAMAAGQQLAQAAGPGMAAAAQQAGVPQSTINAVGSAVNNPAIGQLVGNQTQANLNSTGGQAHGENNQTGGNSGAQSQPGTPPPGTAPAPAPPTPHHPTEAGAPVAPVAGSPPETRSADASHPDPVGGTEVASAEPVAASTTPLDTHSGDTTVHANDNTTKDDQAKAHPDVMVASAAADAIKSDESPPVAGDGAPTTPTPAPAAPIAVAANDATPSTPAAPEAPPPMQTASVTPPPGPNDPQTT